MPFEMFGQAVRHQEIRGGTANAHHLWRFLLHTLEQGGIGESLDFWIQKDHLMSSLAQRRGNIAQTQRKITRCAMAHGAKDMQIRGFNEHYFHAVSLPR